MTTTPRVLLVAPMHSHPPDQGNAARLAAFGAELRARGAWVELLYYGLEGLGAEREAAMRAAWDAFHFLPAQPHAPMRFPAYWGLDDWCPPALAEAVATLHQARPYQAVVANYVWLSGALAGAEGALRVIDTHDLFGDRHHQAVRDGLAPGWYFTGIAEEARGLDRADLVLAIQDEEAAVLRRRTAREVLTVGHPPGLEFLREQPGRRALARFGVLASGNPWNLASVQALDAALAGEPALDWLLAGGILRHPALRLRSAPLRQDIGATRDFYALAECALNPMQGGTGLKIKTVEALGFGAAVLGTRDAFAGLPTEHPAQRTADAAALLPFMREYAASLTFRREVILASRTLALTYAATVTRHYDELFKRIGR